MYFYKLWGCDIQELFKYGESDNKGVGSDVMSCSDIMSDVASILGGSGVDKDTLNYNIL
jgi:hypothetical protein